MLETILNGGFMMFPLLLCSLIAVTIVIDRIFAFMTIRNVDNFSLRSKSMEMLMQNRPADALLVCADTPGPVAAVLMSGFQAMIKHQRIGTSPDNIARAVEKAMEDYSMHALAAVEKRLVGLSTVGNAAPLLGMTGTVVGMIMAFQQLSADAGGAGGAAKVAEGISVALITTAAGLIIALIAVIPYRWFIAQSDAIALEIDEASTEMIDILSTRMVSPSTSAQATTAVASAPPVPSSTMASQSVDDEDASEQSATPKKVRRKVVKKVRRKKTEE